MTNISAIIAACVTLLTQFPTFDDFVRATINDWMNAYNVTKTADELIYVFAFGYGKQSNLFGLYVRDYSILHLIQSTASDNFPCVGIALDKEAITKLRNRFYGTKALIFLGNKRENEQKFHAYCREHHATDRPSCFGEYMVSQHFHVVWREDMAAYSATCSDDVIDNDGKRYEVKSTSKARFPSIHTIYKTMRFIVEYGRHPETTAELTNYHID